MKPYDMNGWCRLHHGRRQQLRLAAEQHEAPMAPKHTGGLGRKKKGKRGDVKRNGDLWCFNDVGWFSDGLMMV